MEGILKINVEFIKYNGRNKKIIVDRLGINDDEYLNFYFQNKNVYFIIPKHNTSDWFILNETQFKKKIETGRK